MNELPSDKFNKKDDEYVEQEQDEEQKQIQKYIKEIPLFGRMKENLLFGDDNEPI